MSRVRGLAHPQSEVRISAIQQLFGLAPTKSQVGDLIVILLIWLQCACSFARV